MDLLVEIPAADPDPEVELTKRVVSEIDHYYDQKIDRPHFGTLHCGDMGGPLYGFFM